MPVLPRDEQTVARLQVSLDAWRRCKQWKCDGTGGLVVQDLTAVGAQGVVVGGGEGVQGRGGAGGVAANAFAANNLNEEVVPGIVVQG